MDISWRMETSSTEESAEESNDGNDQMHVRAEKLDAINKLLTLDGHKPLKHALQASWVDASEKTKRF